MRCLVTGGNGFIGSHVVRALEADGHAVRVMAQPGTPVDTLAGTRAEVAAGDLVDPASLAAAVRGVEAVFHLAAKVGDFGPREAFLKVNAEGTWRLARAAVAAGARRFVLVSTVAVHRLPPGGIVDGDEDLPRDNVDLPYAESKIRAEDAVMDEHAAGRIEGVVVRPGLFPFGPGDRTSFLPLVRNLRFYAHVDGGRARLCTAYVDNLARGIALAGTVPAAAGRVYVLSDGPAVTWADLMDRVCRAVGRAPVRRSVPYEAALVAARASEALYALTGRPPLVTRYRVSVAARGGHFTGARARRELGWDPAVGLDEGLARTAAWLRSIGEVR